MALFTFACRQDSSIFHFVYLSLSRSLSLSLPFFLYFFYELIQPLESPSHMGFLSSIMHMVMLLFLIFPVSLNFIKILWCLLWCSENSGLHVFNFLANSILKEVLTAIQKGKPGAFSPGRPTEFLKNYKSSLDFLAHLEGNN